MRIKPFESIEDIVDSVKTVEQAAGIKDEPAVHVARKEERYKDRSRKTGKGILRARKVTEFVSSKKWKFWGQVGVWWSCGKMGHEVTGCPDLGKAKSDGKPKVKEASVVNTASVKPLPARKLPVVDWEIDTRKQGDQGETISCLLDTGSEITMARTEMKEFAENVCMTDVGFSGVGTKGTAKEAGTLRMKVGEEWLDLGVHFVETIPKGLDVIVGLDNQLNCVDLERGEGKLGRHYFSFHMQEDKKEEDEIAKAAGGDKDLKALLEKNLKLFAGDEKYFPLSKLHPVKIKLLPNARPVKVPPHHMSPKDEQMIEEKIGEMAAKGLLERIRDPKWVFPFFVAKGKGRRKGKKRTAVDFRRLNPW